MPGIPNFINDPLPPINPGESHIAVVLLVDTSGSMAGAPIKELNQGLVEFGNAIQSDELAMGRADISIISFNSTVQTEMGFRPANQYEAPTLSANGGTSMNQAIETALDELEQRKALYKQNGTKYYRPWLFLLTDGVPTDNAKLQSARDKLQYAIDKKKVTFIPMAIGSGADKNHLQGYYPPSTQNKVVLQASASNFKDAFVWLSASVSLVSSTDLNVEKSVNLPPTPSTITVGL